MGPIYPTAGLAALAAATAPPPRHLESPETCDIAAGTTLALVASEVKPMSRMERVREWLAVHVSPAVWRSSARALGVVTAMMVLAALGSGRMARWLNPSAALGARTAQAATAEAGTVVTLPTTVIEVPRASLSPAVEAADEARDAGDLGDAGDGDGGVAAIAADGKVILNLAAEDDLRRLPGIGHGRAQAILALRARLKKFTRIEDLLKVKGIGRKGIARLRPLVRID